MFEEYKPEKFCRDYIDIKGSIRQLVMFMAVIFGIKPVMDDWVEKERYDRFVKICGNYGLSVKPDAVFFGVDDPLITKKSVGKETLTTTIANGRRFESAKPGGMVHVFIAKDKDNLEKAFFNGWYPLVVKNRVIQKPYIDLLKFGYNLGYPRCCVNFFRHFNDWNKYSNLYETLRNTSGKPSYLCNCFTKDVVYSYIYHIPCSFNCLATVEKAQALRDEIGKKEPLFVELIDAHLKLPFLIFYETVMYAFEGEMKDNKLYYKRVYFIGRGEGRNDIYGKILEQGNCLFLDGKDVIILKNGKQTNKIKNQPSEFAPVIPFLIQFD